MNMLKFLRGSGQPSPSKRSPPIKQPPEKQPELFAFRKTVQHGFPHKPTALAYDPKDKLMAIATHSGAIKIFGRPGVEFYGQHVSATNNANECVVQLLEFVSGTGRIVSLTTSNQLILWEPVAGAMLVPINQVSFDGKLKKVSSICCSIANDLVWIGTEGGNVYQFDLKNFAIKEPVIYHDVVLEQVPSTYKLNPGAVEAVKQIPANTNHLLIAYNRGLCVIWDLESGSVARSFISPGHGQSVGLHISPDCEDFTWYHADGSFSTWNLIDSEKPTTDSVIVYGPDPCKSINHLVKAKRGDDDLIVFSGGMPRSAYGDRHCVTVQSSDGSHVCLDFSSKVIDFFVTFKEDEDDPSQAQVLIVLLEEELSAYDLTDIKLPTVRLPYLHSVHVSAVTCNHLQSQVTSEVYNKIIEAGLQQSNNQNSEIEWPITGGTIPVDSEDPDVTLVEKEYEILITGHEDGTIKFWDCTGVILAPLLHFRTAPVFGCNHASNEAGDIYEDDEPPFRRAGFFDPYSDDPRLAVKKVALCPKTGQIVIAGTAGHVVVGRLDHDDDRIKVTTVNLVSEGFVWKGHDQLTVASALLDEDEPAICDGVQLTRVVQIHPPAAINALALQSSWNLIAAGTAHGLVIYDYVQHNLVKQICTLNPKDVSESGEALSRRKSFKKTLRESFRRLRRGRSTRNAAGGAPAAPVIETRPMERQIEARSTEDAVTSMVRCLTFADTHMVKNAPHKTFPSLWFGTYAYVCAYILHIPAKPVAAADGTIPAARPITADKGKEITFKQHKAPIVGITVFDVHTGLPLELAAVDENSARSPHRIVIATEEQFKIFSLPELSVKDKYKLTAKEGVRIRRMSFARFSARKAPAKPAAAEETLAVAATAVSAVKQSEVGMMCLTNAGDCIIFSVPDLKKKLNAAAVRREDINGITSLCFTTSGEALYMMSSSELQRVTLSANKVVVLDGSIDLIPLNYPEEEDQRSLVHRHDNREDDDDDDDDNKSDVMDATLATVTSRGGPSGDQLAAVAKSISPVNGLRSAGSALDVTTTSSMGDMTLDSIRDHLNSSTITTLHKQTTEEVVGRLSVLSTQTNHTTTVLKMSEIGDNINLPNFKDLSSMGETAESSTSSMVIKSVITSVTSSGVTSAEHEESTTTTTTTSSAATNNTAKQNGNSNKENGNGEENGDSQENGINEEYGNGEENGATSDTPMDQDDEDDAKSASADDDEDPKTSDPSIPVLPEKTSKQLHNTTTAPRSPTQIIREESQL